MKFLSKKSRSAFFIILLLLGAGGKISAQYAVGDFGSTASASWNVGGTWSTWNGAAWVATGLTPGAANNVFILTGSTVVLSVSGSGCRNLTVEAGAILWTLSGTNTYINVYGPTFVCNGQIGNGTTFDGISFNIEGATCTITGTGQFDASRLRKSFATAPLTALNITCNINLRWNAASGTQLYNAASLTNFNVTIGTGYTVTLVPNGAITGNVSIDGLDGGAGTPDAGGTFTINGTLLISGKLYLTTNNASATYKCNWIIGTTGLVQTSEIVASASGLAGHTLAVNGAGRIDINGTAAWSSLSTTNNTYTYANTSTIQYSATGIQLVRVAAEFGGAINNQYGYLILSGSGLKSTTTAGSLYVRSDLTITGTAVLDPNPTGLFIFVGGNWINYSETGYFEKTSTVYLNGTGLLQTVTCPGGEVFHTLRYQNSNLLARVQFNDNVDVINALIFASNGYVDLNFNTLKIRNAATAGITGASATRYIYAEKVDNSSKIIWQINSNTGVYTFPFGVPPGTLTNYIPVVLTKNSGTNIGDVTISTYFTLPTNLPWPSMPTLVTNLKSFIPANNTPDNRDWTVDRFWEVSSTSPQTVDSLRFSYRSSERPTADSDPNNYGAQFWNTTYWFNQQYGVPTAYNVAVPGFSIFNTAWTISSLLSPLPVKLLSFEATPGEEKVKLDWVTASEINNDYFTVEKSIDNREFFEIGKVEGAGNTTSKQEYFLNDTRPFYGISYYRLKQTDFDGTFTYSETVPVNYKKEFTKFTIFPNPATDEAYLINESGSAPEIIVRDVEGKLIQNYFLNESKQIQQLPITELKHGIYFIEVKTDFDSQFLRLIKN